RVGSRARAVSLHAHSSRARREAVLEALRQGGNVALITDAGTPAVSDPGAELVALAHGSGAPVVSVPGPSAVAAALSVSGLPADRYLFLGFLPRKGPSRRDLVEQLAACEWTTVVFEAGNRLVDTLDQLAAACEEGRRAAVARELTKVHEEARTGTLAELAGYYREHPPRGEVTVVVGGRAHTPLPVEAGDARERARHLLAAGLTRRDAADRLAGELGLSRNRAYALVTNL
ncbi:MAG TPA: ribosomal RNA small subunit methyltransferase I, partial [Gemmatimonadales bacterium]|nr:ribosomal RNA small subunit methyltransferase I [Gemmatimonadales bacterium]